MWPDMSMRSNKLEKFPLGCCKKANSAQRLGRAVGQRPRPLLATFASVSEKHHFLQWSSDLRREGFQLDDNFTRKQQQEREELNNFVCLKAEGYKPYFGGLQLKFHYKVKTRRCKKGEADNKSLAF